MSEMKIAEARELVARAATLIEGLASFVPDGEPYLEKVTLTLNAKVADAIRTLLTDHERLTDENKRLRTIFKHPSDNEGGDVECLKVANVDARPAKFAEPTEGLTECVPAPACDAGALWRRRCLMKSQAQPVTPW